VIHARMSLPENLWMGVAAMHDDVAAYLGKQID
jgi:hypothetical protein